ncbi:MDR family MFS transporter [Alsobacter sp. SYSU BS001988]
MNASPPDAIRPALTHEEIRLVILGILVAMFLAALDQTIVATALPTIGRELGNAELLSWIVTAYLVTATAITPLYGKLSDIHGRRPTMLVGIAVFVLGSVACALAPNMIALILARALQGLGGGGLISMAQTIIADMVAPKERGRYQVYIAGVFVSSSLAGPVLGGFFAEHLHWSIIFWINIPLGIVAFAMTNSLLRKLPQNNRPHSLDVLGAALMITATTLLLLALNWGGLRYSWTSWQVIALLTASAAGWVAFGLRLGSASEPLIPLTLFANGVVRNGTLAACFGMGAFIGMTIYTPVYLETVKGLSASDSGLALIPLMIGTVMGATISGRAMAHVTHYKRLPIGGLMVAIGAVLALARWGADLPFVGLEILFGVISLGLGTLLPVTTVCIQNAAPVHQLGTATASMNFFRSLGGALLVAAFGAILLAGGVVGGLHGSTPGQAHAAADPGALAAFARMFQGAAASLAMALVFLVAMEERPLRGRSAPAPAAD